jgi:D-lyxose ketol-isomerase
MVTRFTRSLINRTIDAAQALLAQRGIRLPAYGYWTPAQWRDVGAEADEIRRCHLGWDVTDFGSGDFPRIGRCLFTLRNGTPPGGHAAKHYAEKLIIDPEGQRAPPHFHRSKIEDIINRQGGNLLVALTASDAEGLPDPQRTVRVQVDGLTRRVSGGETIRLEPGQSLCIPPGTIHQFWGEPGTGTTISGEVSSVSDDHADNAFIGAYRRFPTIIEDEPARWLLCNEYPEAALKAVG